MIELEVNNYIKICIDEPNELLELMTGDDKVKLISSLSCHDEVIEHVLNQVSLLYGHTEDGSSGWSSGVCGNTVLDLARMKLAKSASQLSKDTIEVLERKLKDQEHETREWCEKYHNLKGGRA